jgi:hypothetical protein
VDGTTLTAGGPAVTISDTVVSLASGSSYLVVGGSTIPIASPTFAPFIITNGPGNFPITIMPNSPVIVDGTTLTPGGPAVTISGTIVSLASGSSYLVVGSSTIPIGASPPATTESSDLSSLTWSGIGGRAKILDHRLVVVVNVLAVWAIAP